jgi:hypothetical protein
MSTSAMRALPERLLHIYESAGLFPQNENDALRLFNNSGGTPSLQDKRLPSFGSHNFYTPAHLVFFQKKGEDADCPAHYFRPRRCTGLLDNSVKEIAHRGREVQLYPVFYFIHFYLSVQEHTAPIAALLYRSQPGLKEPWGSSKRLPSRQQARQQSIQRQEEQGSVSKGSRFQR